jgi:hypothetical protein
VKRPWLVPILLTLIALQTLTQVGVVLYSRKQKEFEVYAVVSNYVQRRSQDQYIWHGYDKEAAARVARVARAYHIQPTLLAAIGRTENGWLTGETGYNGKVIPTYIKTQFGDPRDWPWAACCDLVNRIALKYVQQPENLGPFLETLGRRYNNTEGAKEWAFKVTSFELEYRIGIPETPGKPAKKGR